MSAPAPPDAHLNALIAAAADGVALDGLRVSETADGYAFRLDAGALAVDREGLSAEDLRRLAREHPRFVSNWHYWSETLGGPPGDAPEPRARAAADPGDVEDSGAVADPGAVADHGYAFLRWVERAGERSVPERYDALAAGTTRSWGQLHIEARLEGDDGGETAGMRRYDLRHEADADAATADLNRYDDPFEARHLAKHDEGGRYRPLKTAPSLRTGWAFPDLHGPGLLRAVESFYPATVANWHLERRGELDVDHWRETVARQTGIYGVVDTWDRQEGHEHVDWVAEACCVDSQCLKRREWEYDDDTDLDVDGGDGAFPCREPCSLVIAAARKWTRLEGEAPRTYEFELTPSEKEQVEAIIAAVADGRVDDVREADLSEGANRYRARFLRAKRFDAEGNLSGTPTDPGGDGDGP